MRNLFGSICVALSLLTAARADNSNELFARLDRAAAATTLYAPTLKPWHMKVAFTLNDDTGKNPQQGTLEEWWGGPTQDRITYTSPAFTGTVLHIGDETLVTPRAGLPPFALETMHEALVNPLKPELYPKTRNPALEKTQFGTITLDCITISPKSVKSAHAPTGLYPTSCFDPGSDRLRYVSRYVAESVVRNVLGSFQGQSVAVALKVMEGSVESAQAKVTTLGTMPVNAMDFTTTGVEASRPVQKVPGGVVAGTQVHKFAPVYPESATTSDTR